MNRSSLPLRRAFSSLAACALIASAAQAQSAGEALYEVTFDATWSGVTHPHAFPVNAHFSSPVGIAHDDTVSFWAPGELATLGIERMAEQGLTFPLEGEFDVAIQAGTALETVVGPSLGSPAQVVFDLRVSTDHPLATIVTMIAPSPDWFVGVHGLSLLDGNERFVDELTVELLAYDAGTDDGVDFDSNNANSDPPQPISRITTRSGGPFTGDDPLGTFTFRRLHSTQTYGCDVNPRESLRVVAGEPRIGAGVRFELDAPGTLLQGPATTLLLGSASAAPGFPCGSPLFGNHRSLARRAELLIQAPVLLRLDGGTWTGDPVQIDLSIPNSASFVGLTFYVQGAMFGDLSVVLTEAVEMLIGS